MYGVYPMANRARLYNALWILKDQYPSIATQLVLGFNSVYTLQDAFSKVGKGQRVLPNPAHGWVGNRQF